MATEQQIDRSVLAGKDRDELHTIAGAIGVKAATRMRKADLIDAILAAANGGERVRRHAESPIRRAPPAEPRSRAGCARRAPRRRSADDALAALADEENALGGDATDAERADAAPAWPPRRARTGRAARRRPSERTGDSRARRLRLRRHRRRTTSTTDAGADDNGPGSDDDDDRSDGDDVDPEDERQSFGEGNRRGRRRRRGRGGQDQPAGDGRPGRVPGRPDPGAGPARPPRRGLRLPPRRRLPARRRRTSTSRRRRCGASRCARATSSRGTSRPQASNEKYPALLRVDDINGLTPDDARARPALRGPHAAVPRRRSSTSSSARRPAARSPVGSST